MPGLFFHLFPTKNHINICWIESVVRTNGSSTSNLGTCRAGEGTELRDKWHAVTSLCQGHHWKMARPESLEGNFWTKKPGQTLDSIMYIVSVLCGWATDDHQVGGMQIVQLKVHRKGKHPLVQADVEFQFDVWEHVALGARRRRGSCRFLFPSLFSL